MYLKNYAQSVSFLKKHREMRGKKVYSKVNTNLKDFSNAIRIIGEGEKPLTIAKINKITEKAN